MAGRQVRRSDYRAARIGAAAAFSMTLITLLLVDAASPTYELQFFQLGGLLTAILTLLGLEARDQFRGLNDEIRERLEDSHPEPAPEESKP